MDQLGIDLIKFDEMETLLLGLHFSLFHLKNDKECFTYRPDETMNEDSIPSSSSSSDNGEYIRDESGGERRRENKDHMLEKKKEEELQELEEEEEERKVLMSSVDDYIIKTFLDTSEIQFPYLVVSIGSGFLLIKLVISHFFLIYLLGVSIIRVDGVGKYSRVSGTSLGGGTFLGLSRLLTQSQVYIIISFEGNPYFFISFLFYCFRSLIKLYL